MVPLDRAMTGSDKLSILTMSLSAAVWRNVGRNFECKVSTCVCLPRAPNYLVNSLIWQRHYSVYGTAVTLGSRFLSATGSRALALKYMRYGRLTLATAWILV